MRQCCHTLSYTQWWTFQCSVISCTAAPHPVNYTPWLPINSHLSIKTRLSYQRPWNRSMQCCSSPHSHSGLGAYSTHCTFFQGNHLATSSWLTWLQLLICHFPFADWQNQEIPTVHLRKPSSRNGTLYSIHHSALKLLLFLPLTLRMVNKVNVQHVSVNESESATERLPASEVEWRQPAMKSQDFHYSCSAIS